MFCIAYEQKALITLTQDFDALFKLESILIYGTSAIASFVPIYGFLVDLNRAYNKINTYNADLKYIATHDPLTGLINRRSIDEQLKDAYAIYAIHDKKFSIILGDIDDFKKVNDTYGHNVGDIVLKSVATILLDNVNASDYVCRWGGEEMLILTPVDIEEATILADKIRNNHKHTLKENESVCFYFCLFQKGHGLHYD
jgi:diguanylate cyclase (GGDEF)-like protein